MKFEENNEEFEGKTQGLFYSGSFTFILLNLDHMEIYAAVHFINYVIILNSKLVGHFKTELFCDFRIF
jgi:hypothetical protein